jgi:hypothetical protein
LGVWRSQGGDRFGAKPSGDYLWNIDIIDTSTPSTGRSVFTFGGNANTSVMVNCIVEPSLNVLGGGRIYAVGLGNVLSVAPTSMYPAIQPDLFGGVFQGGLDIVAASFNLGNNLAVHGNFVFYTSSKNGIVGNIFADGTIFNIGDIAIIGFLWGSYAVQNNGSWLNATGSTFVLKALLTNGAITFGSAVTTGSSYTGSGVYTDGVPLTPANIDAGGAGGVGLTDMLTGYRFAKF